MLNQSAFRSALSFKTVINFEAMQQDQFFDALGRFHSEEDRDHNISSEFNAQFGPAPVADGYAGCIAGHGGTLSSELILVLYISRGIQRGTRHFRFDHRIVE